MNTLNQIIIEGNIESLINNGFVLLYKRDEKEERYTICFSEQMFAQLKSHLRKNRSVRIVGRLSQSDDHVFIVAEHIEFKVTR